jgi:hypothetical protein
MHNKKNPYVMLNKGFLEDNSLSWKAKGLLAYLLSRPDNWKTIVEQLVKKAKDGRDSVLSGLKELEIAGYFSRDCVRNEKGQITEWVTNVFEVPTENPDPGFPEEVKPDPDFPFQGNPRLIINDLMIKDQKKEREEQLEGVEEISEESAREEPPQPLQEQQANLSNSTILPSGSNGKENIGAGAARDNNALRPRGAVLASRTGQQIVYETFNPFHKVQTEKRSFHDDTPWSELAKEVGEKREDVHKVLHEWLVVFVTKNKPQINEPEGYSGGVIHNWVKTPGSHETNPLWCDFASQVREDGLAAIRSRLQEEKQQLTRLATEAERQKEIDRQARLKWQEEQAQKAELARQYWMAQAEKAKKETGGTSTSDPLLDILPTRILNVDDTEYDF